MMKRVGQEKPTRSTNSVAGNGELRAGNRAEEVGNGQGTINKEKEQLAEGEETCKKRIINTLQMKGR
jgi:hypothetical protein